MDGLKATFQKYQSLENKWQLFNPARTLAAFITIPFTALSFIIHLICMGTASNDLAGMDAATTTDLNLTNEFFTDFDWIFHDHDHGHGHDHDHIHIDIVGKALKYVILSPLYILGAAWDYKFSQANADPEKVLTFKQALKKSFSGLREKHAIVPLQLSAEWVKLEKQNRVERAKSKRAARYTQEPGNEVIRDLEAVILAPQALPQTPAYVNNDGSINESSFFKGKSLGQATRETCEKLIKIANGPQYKLSNA